MHKNKSVLVYDPRAYLFLLILGAWMCLPGGLAEAADTVETWEKGAIDVDLYVGFDGIGAKMYDGKAHGNIMFGYGLIDRLSVYLGTSLQGNEYLSDGSGALYLGMFGTPLNTDHFDLDLFINLSVSGPRFSEFEFGPALELNYDLRENLLTWGLYLRVGVPVYGRQVSSPVQSDVPDHQAVFHLDITLGTYWTLVEGHQLLLEYNTAVRPHPAVVERVMEFGGVAFGYNFSITDTLEVITQVYLDIPQGTENIALGIMTGLIASIPSF